MPSGPLLPRGRLRKGATALDDTAPHEIGHTLGLPHEHQNPNAGIVWDEETVYTSLGGPPNNWPREKTQWSILRKIEPDTVQGSNWDPDWSGSGSISARARARRLS